MASKVTRKRTYNEAFLQYGFVNMPDFFGDRPQCVLCCKVLINESLKPGKLKEHLMKCHPGSVSQSITFFQQKANNLQAVKFGKTGLASQQLAAAVEASYEVAYRIAKTQKPHTIAEELILPCSIIKVEKLCGLDQAKKLNAISLSNNTIRRRIDDLAADILEQLISEVLSSSYPKFSMQFDESTDVAACATLIGFIRYVHEGSIKEEMLLCEELPTTTKGADIFNTVDGFLRKARLDWSKVSQVSVDGAPSMMGQGKGFHGLLKEKKQNIEVVHCVIHRYALASRGLPESIKVVLDDVIKIVNFVKSKSLNSHIQRAV